RARPRLCGRRRRPPRDRTGEPGARLATHRRRAAPRRAGARPAVRDAADADQRPLPDSHRRSRAGRQRLPCRRRADLRRRPVGGGGRPARAAENPMTSGGPRDELQFLSIFHWAMAFLTVMAALAPLTWLVVDREMRPA